MSIQTELSTARAKIDSLVRELEKHAKQRVAADEARAKELWGVHRAWMIIVACALVIGLIIGHIA